MGFGGKFAIFTRMKYSSITLTQEGRTAVVTLSRPERRNSLDSLMIRELTAALRGIGNDKEIRAVVLTGAGSSFCSGMDLNYLAKCAKLPRAANLKDARDLMKLLRLVSGLAQPVIAMVNGPALGGGLGLAAASDFVIASRERAFFGAPEARLGFLPAIILIYLIRRMGEGAAKEFVMTGETIDAAHAMARGLVSELAAEGDLRHSAMELSERLSRTSSPESLAMIKEMFSVTHLLMSSKGYEHAAKLNALARATPDFKRGIGSFLAGKKIEW